MSLKRMAGLVLSMIVAAAAIGYSQARNNVKEGKVYVSGENPGIRLLQKEGDPPLTNVNFWKVVYSPAGMGHVCYISSDVTGNGESPDDVHAVFTDNEALLEYLSKEIMIAFDKSYTDHPWTRQKATFQQAGDTLQEFKEIIKAPKLNIELVWRDFSPAFLMDSPTGGSRNPFGITSMMVPAKSADVVINGKKAAGTVFPNTRGSIPSTAFLAFSESWVK